MCSSVACSAPEPQEARLAELENEICELAAHLAAATCRWLLLIPEFTHARLRGAQLDCQNRARGLAIDAKSCMPLSAGDRLDYGIAVEGLLARALSPVRRL